jgi:hypothetical protein
MGNACNCVSKEDQGKEVDLATKDKKGDKAKKDQKSKPQNHDESEILDEDGDEGKDDPELVNAAIKIQVGYAH